MIKERTCYILNKDTPDPIPGLAQVSKTGELKLKHTHTHTHLADTVKHYYPFKTV